MCDQGVQDQQTQSAPDYQAQLAYSQNHHYAPVVHYYHPTTGQLQSVSADSYPLDSAAQASSISAIGYNQTAPSPNQSPQKSSQQQPVAAIATTSTQYAPNPYFVHHHQQIELPSTNNYYQQDYQQGARSSSASNSFADYNNQSRYYSSGPNQYNAYSQQSRSQPQPQPQQQQQSQPYLAIGAPAYGAPRALEAPAAQQAHTTGALNAGAVLAIASEPAHTAAQVVAREATATSQHQQPGPSSGCEFAWCARPGQPERQAPSSAAKGAPAATNGQRQRQQRGLDPGGDPVRAGAPSRADAPLAAAGGPERPPAAAAAAAAAATRTLLARAQQQPVKAAQKAPRTRPSAQGAKSSGATSTSSGSTSGASATSGTSGETKKSGLLVARRKNATRETTAMLKDWLDLHGHNPYPTKGEKIMLSIITKMSLTQVSTWFANARRRMKKENKSYPWINNHHNYQNQANSAQSTSGDLRQMQAASSVSAGNAASPAPAGLGPAEPKGPEQESSASPSSSSSALSCASHSSTASLATSSVSSGGFDDPGAQGGRGVDHHASSSPVREGPLNTPEPSQLKFPQLDERCNAFLCCAPSANSNRPPVGSFTAATNLPAGPESGNADTLAQTSALHLPPPPLAKAD